MKIKILHAKSYGMGCSKISTNREVYNNIGLPQQTGKVSIKQFDLTLKETRKRINEALS